jgi:hypothetical protein
MTAVACPNLQLRVVSSRIFWQALWIVGSVCGFVIMRCKPAVVKDSKAKLEKFASDGNKWYKKCQLLVSRETTPNEDYMAPSPWGGELAAQTICAPALPGTR